MEMPDIEATVEGGVDFFWEKASYNVHYQFW